MPKPVPRQRKHKARARAAAESQIKSVADANALEIIPPSKSEKEERRQKLKEELRAQKSKSSSKKNKRLDKYIDTKLKKEENLELLKKLAQHKVDTSLFQSSKKLGRGHESKKEALSRALREKRAGLEIDGNDELLYAPAPVTHAVGSESSDNEELEDVNNTVIEQRVSPPPTQAVPVPQVAFGAGLKRPLEVDDSGNPIIQRRKRIKLKTKTRFSVPAQDSEWEGFGSGSEDEENSSKTSDSEGSMSGSDADLNSEHNSEEDVSEDESSEATSEIISDDDEDDSEDEDEDEDEDIQAGRKEAKQERSSAFKDWANQERNVALGFTPSLNTDLLALAPGSATTRRETLATGGASNSMETLGRIQLPLTSALELSTQPTRTAFAVSVTRPSDVEESRLALPVVAEEQKIMEAIYNHDTTIISGETGSGKTTQIPQFLYEAGYGDPNGPTPGMIGVTQPRRVAAVSMAKRVAVELGNAKDKVSYQIRFDSTVSTKTAIKFMTDGVLLREISQDFTLAKYSVIVIDEAHERSVNTDILIGMLSRIVETRTELAKKQSTFKPLKLIIMSATLKTTDFQSNKSLFRKSLPPIVEVEGRQYDVKVHFARKTKRDYVEEMFNKVCAGHKKLPPGGMLVFLTGQGEIQHLAKRLKQTFSSTQGAGVKHADMRISAAEVSVEDEDVELSGGRANAEDNDEESDTEIYGVDNDEDREFNISDEPHSLLNVHVLPLYSQLPMEQQSRVFEPPPDGSRLIILATNVAETSLTIPGIRYVFDCGRAKEKKYDRLTGIQTFDVGWISKASADQRKGRAGRTAPGHCYRLYSSAVFERDFVQFAEPEIQRAPIEGVVLQLKSMGIPKITNFPFPTPPSRDSLVHAERLLEYLGALSDGKVTAVGKDLSVYPLSPRLSRILNLAQQHNCIEYAVTLVAALAVPNIFVGENQLDISETQTANENGWSEADNIESIERDKRRKAFNSFHGNASRLDRTSDAIKLLTTVCDFTSADAFNIDSYKTFARTKALHEAIQLRSQLVTIVNAYHPGSIASTGSTGTLTPPSAHHIQILRQIMAAGYIDQIAIRADLSPNPPVDARKPKRSIDVPYISLFPSHTGRRATTDSGDEVPEEKYVYLHPSSILSHTTSAAKMPQFVVYSHISRAVPSFVTEDGSLGSVKPPKARFHPLTPTLPAHIVAVAQGTPLLDEGKPVGKIEQLPRGKDGKERRVVWTVPFLRPGASGGLGWPLPPARKVVQRREGTKGWIVERDIEEAAAAAAAKKP